MDAVPAEEPAAAVTPDGGYRPFVGAWPWAMLAAAFAFDVAAPAWLSAWAAYPVVVLLAPPRRGRARALTLAGVLLAVAGGGVALGRGDDLVTVAANRCLAVALVAACWLTGRGGGADARRHADRYRSLALATGQVVWTTDAQGQMEEDSPSWRAFSGQTYGQYRGRGWLDAVHPDDRGPTAGVWSRAVAGRTLYATEYRLRRADGAYRAVLVRGVPVPEPDGAVREWVGTCTDITELKEAGQRLRDRETLLRAVSDGTTDAVFVKDLAGRYLMINPAGANFVGLPVAEILGRDDTVLFSPGTAAAIMARDREVMAGGGPQTFEEEGAAAGVTRVYFSTKAPYRDAGGRVIGLVGISRDVTERKQMERLLAERAAELERSNAELEQFAYVASHDLQEPLRMVNSYMELLARRYDGELDERARRWIGFAAEGALRMKELVNDLLHYSRVGTRGKSFAPVDCARVAADALANLGPAVLEAGAEVRCGPLPVVVGDATQLLQVFQNLVGNALKYRGDRPPLVEVSAERQPAGWLFRVKDNGIGIGPEYFERIFVIFQRLHTRAEYPGTGIGLAVCDRIVRRHGGRIWVESQPGQGATFCFTIPDRGGPGHAPAERQAAGHPAGGGQPR